MDTRKKWLMVKLKCHFVYYYFLISSKVFKSCNSSLSFEKHFIKIIHFYMHQSKLLLQTSDFFHYLVLLTIGGFRLEISCWKNASFWIFSVFSLFAQKHFAPQRNVLNNMVYKHFLQFCSRQINNKLNSNVHLFIACMENCNRSDLEHGSAIWPCA